MNQRLSTSLLLGVVLTVSVLAAIALAAGSSGVALADDVSLPITVVNITANPQPLNEPIIITAVFTDPGVVAPSSYTADWDWGDGSSSSCGPGSNSEACTIIEQAKTPEYTEYLLVDDSHVYTDPGVYTVVLEVTRIDGGVGTSNFEYMIVYDPNGGFVTGGGWIDSLEGAYAPDPLLTGKATFGFVSKYKKGADAPIGQTQFQFQVADLNFHSSDYEWLVVNQGGSRAQFKGSGTINGQSSLNGDYKFQLWATDGDPDKFRIRIWWEDMEGSENTVYDNGSDQAIGGGSIVIHKGKGQQ